MDEVLDKKDPITYEISFLLGSEDNSKIKEILTKNGAKVLFEKPLEKSRLAYPILKQSLAYAGVINFETEPSVLEKISADLKLSGEVLRCLITKIDHGVQTQQIEMRDREPRAESQLGARKRTFFGRDKKKPESVNLTNEALEKKIEEILK